MHGGQRKISASRRGIGRRDRRFDTPSSSRTQRDRGTGAAAGQQGHACRAARNPPGIMATNAGRRPCRHARCRRRCGGGMTLTADNRRARAVTVAQCAQAANFDGTVTMIPSRLRQARAPRRRHPVRPARRGRAPPRHVPEARQFTRRLHLRDQITDDHQARAWHRTTPGRGSCCAPDAGARHRVLCCDK